jgi:plastocyanin
MSRGTAPRLTLIALVTAAVAYVAVPLAGPANAAAEHRIRVTDSAFDPVPADVEQGDTVIWVLQPSAQLTHTVTSEDGLFRAELVPNSANTEFSYTFNAAGKFTYFCENHLQSNFMAGQIRVAETPPPPTTTTTTEPPPTTTTTAPPPTTTTTAAPPPTTTTTRPRSTTTTTRPPATEPTTEPPAQASTEKPDTTSTTARGTTTPGKPTTTTSGKKKPSTTTTQALETTTSSTLPAEWIPTPDIVPDDASTTTSTSPDTEEAASSKPKSGNGGGGGGFPLAGVGILGLLVVGGAGWGWYHRSSRYLPA